MLVEEDPQYFYNILPYAYILGVSSKWISKFDGIAMEPPTWYRGDSYDTMHMNHRIEDTMDSVTHDMLSAPSSSSSGSSGGFSSSGSSGGGFSGGGSGGGGGHSW